MRLIKERKEIPTLEIPIGRYRFGFREHADGRMAVELFVSDTKAKNIGANASPPEDEVLFPVLQIILEDYRQAETWSEHFSRAAKIMRANGKEDKS